MKRIIIDTNFLMIPLAFGVDIFTEFSRIMDEAYQVFVLDKTVDELEHIIETQSGKDRAAARFAFKMLSEKNVEVMKTTTKGTADDALLEIDDIIVATQDKELKQKLKAQKKSVIVLRQKTHLMLDAA